MERSLGLVTYDRQEQLDTLIQHVNSHKYNIIIGCGGVGFWAGIFLAMMGHTGFVLIDGDKIEPTNLNRLPVPQNWVGMSKVLALKRLIRMLRPEAVVTCIRAHVTHDEIDLLKQTVDELVRYGLNIIDTTDDARIQRKIFDTLSVQIGRGDIEYTKMGYEGLEVGAYKDYNVWVPADYRPGYRTTNANATTSAIAAGLGVFKLLIGDDDDMRFDIGKTVNKDIETLRQDALGDNQNG